MDSEDPFSIADLGTADSKNSIKLFKAIIIHLREANPELEVVIYLNDLPF